MSQQDIQRLKDRVMALIDRRADEIVEISDQIHSNPELAFEEFKAADLLSTALEGSGFAVERGIAGLETAFKAALPASGGHPQPVIALLAEYDALPEIGHACGHNIIAAAAVGAGMGLAGLGQELPGTVWVLGTPAEEGGGGKVYMVEDGVFDGVDAAMMVHPASRFLLGRGALAARSLTFTFHGRPAHAAGSPEKGINALDGLIQTFNGVNALRQHLKEEVRIHGIVSKGGDAPNIVPELAEGKFIVRARSREYLDEVQEKVIRCAEAGALAAGASLDVVEGVLYAERRPNKAMVQCFKANLESLGISDITVVDPMVGSGSSDIGNVSLTVPTIHPYIAITDDAIGHSREFTEASASPRAREAAVLAAKALAITALDLMLDDQMLAAARKEFETEVAGS